MDYLKYFTKYFTTDKEYTEVKKSEDDKNTDFEKRNFDKSDKFDEFDNKIVETANKSMFNSDVVKNKKILKNEKTPLLQQKLNKPNKITFLRKDSLTEEND